MTGYIDDFPPGYLNGVYVVGMPTVLITNPLTSVALYTASHPQAMRSIAGGVGELAPPQKRKTPKKRGVAGPAIEAPQRG